MPRGTGAANTAPVPRNSPVRMDAVAAAPILLSPQLADGCEAVQINAHACRRGVLGASRRYLHGVLGAASQSIAGEHHLRGLHGWCVQVHRLGYAIYCHVRDAAIWTPGRDP